MKTRTIAAAALLLAAAPAWAAPETSCPAVAAAIRAMPPPANVDKASDLIDHPLQRLSGRPGSPVSLDLSQPLGTDAVAALARQGKAGALPLGDMDLDEVDMVWLRKAGATGIQAVETEAGTLDCSSFVMFRPVPGQPAKAIAAPPQIAAAAGQDGDTAFCGTDVGLVGVIAGAAMFAESGWDPVEPQELMSLATWRGGAWTDPCTIEVRYRATYAIAQAFCDGAACPAIAKAVVDMAGKREAQIAAHGDVSAAPSTFTWGPKLTTADRAKVATLKRLLGGPHPFEFPTLGKGDPPVHGFGDDSVAFPAVVGGRAYLAVLSHGSIGWRVFPDYVAALYDLKDGKLAPVAGFDIDRNVGPLASIKVGRWTPPKS